MGKTKQVATIEKMLCIQKIFNIPSYTWTKYNLRYKATKTTPASQIASHSFHKRFVEALKCHDV